MTITLPKPTSGRGLDPVGISYTVREPGTSETVVSAPVPEEFENFEILTRSLLTVPKGELMTREIESDPTTAEELRRARDELRSGRGSTQEEVDQD